MGTEKCLVHFQSFTHWNEHPEWRVIEPAYLDTWRQANAWLSATPIDAGFGPCGIELDLSPCIAHIERNYELTRRIYDLKDGSAFDEFEADAIRIEATVSGPSVNDYRASELLRITLFQLFLMMNLSSPGCFNPYSILIEGAWERSLKERASLRGHFSLNARIFENALLDASKRPWLPVGFIPLLDVQEWLSTIAPVGKILPQNRSARSVFALLHLAKTEMGPVHIAWIFHALESLFDCKPGEGFSRLVERISALLSLSVRHQTLLRKSLRQLYDYRSAFVHGGLEVVHPVRDEGYDEEAEDMFDRNIQASDLGGMVIVACLQNIIGRKWRYPVFQELMSGEALTV